MKDTFFTGVCTALVTPFLDGKLNLPMFERLIFRQLENGIKALVVCGTTGEASTLSDEEKVQIIRKAKEIVKNRSLVIAGTGSNVTEQAVTLSMEAEKQGADAVLIVSPYYNKATPEGLYEHYRKIAERISIPIILYNIPSRTGVDIPVNVYQRLSELPNIIGVKEATSDLKKILSIRMACPSRFSVWCGNDDLAIPYLAAGASGVISVLSNILPRETNDMVCAALDGDFDTALELQILFSPVIDFLFCEVNPIPVKAMLKKLGFDCGTGRLPLTELNETHKKQLDKLFL